MRVLPVCTIEHQHSVDIPINSRELTLKCSLHVHVLDETGKVLQETERRQLRNLAKLIAGYLETSIRISFEPSRLMEDIQVLIKNPHEEASQLCEAFTGLPSRELAPHCPSHQTKQS